jgi:Uma2 family endonuclease
MNPLLEFLPKYTHEDYDKWEGKWELIHGHAVDMNPTPSIRHQEVTGKIHVVLLQEIKNCSHCHALQAVDWKIQEDTVVRPDNLVFSGEIENPNYLTKTPTIIFEVLSPSTELKDMNAKYTLFEHAGVLFYVLVNPLTNEAQIFTLHHGKYQYAGEFGHEIYLFELSNCSIFFDFSHIW